MNQSLSSPEPWRDCPPGELLRMLRTIKIDQRRRAMKQLAATGAAIVVFGGVGYAAFDRARSPRAGRYGGLACSGVLVLLPDYRARRLSADRSRQVTLHLRDCPNCGPAFRKPHGSSSI